MRRRALPMVLLVLGGGEGTLQVVEKFLSCKRPVVVLPESGGAAEAIERFVCGEPGSSADGEWANPGYVAPAVSDEMLSSLVKAQNGQEQAKVTAAARERLASIREMGRKEEGQAKKEHLSFFLTSADVENQSNDLGAHIMKAILSDCESTMQAIGLAVEWDPLERGQAEPARGLATGYPRSPRSAPWNVA